VSRLSHGLFQIGEVSRRTGVTVDVIRAWERRYGLLQPTRSEGNFRLYCAQDVARLRLMRHYIQQNIAPSRAAVLVTQAKARLASNPGIPAADMRKAVAVLHGALERFDGAAAEQLLGRLVSLFTPGVVLRDVILPYLREFGERWDGDDAAVAQQHLATCLLEGWMLGVARGQGGSDNRTAVLACVPGEHHALGLAAFAVALADHDWKIVYLGRDAPLEVVQTAADAVGADAIVLAATLPDALADAADAIGELAQRRPVMLGGRATPHVAPALVSAHVLAPEILLAARMLAERAPGLGAELALR
jgi:DNA-binding transcriptional MerR regulator